MDKNEIIRQIPIVSVCVVTYNHRHYIRDCLMSIIAQSTDVPIEILVGNDHSDDGTSMIINELANEFPHLIRHFYHTERLGFGSMNYQLLIKKAKGKYIAHLDGDDFWLPGKLAAQISFMEKNTDCPVVYTNAFTIYDDGSPMGLFNNPQPMRIDINDLVRHGNFLNHSSILYRSSLRENILKIQPPFLDYQIHLCHAQHGKIGYINQALVVYRVGSRSSVIIQANDRVRRLYWEALLNTPPESVKADALAKGIAEFARSVFFRSIKIRNVSLIRQWLPIIMAGSPVSRAKMSILIFSAIIKVGIRESVTALYASLSGNSLKILYYR